MGNDGCGGLPAVREAAEGAARGLAPCGPGARVGRACGQREAAGRLRAAGHGGGAASHVWSGEELGSVAGRDLCGRSGDFERAAGAAWCVVQPSAREVADSELNFA
uniref:Uncharacterized protein n=1 Tax=Arundo donax TaxID=35708 RepID=A0A0A9AZ70_ARUDO